MARQNNDKKESDGGQNGNGMEGGWHIARRHKAFPPSQGGNEKETWKIMAKWDVQQRLTGELR